MKKHLPLFIAAATMILVHEFFSTETLTRLIQIPSGYMASFLIGAPVSFDGILVHIHAEPHLTVSPPCSGVRLFAILTGLGAGYWCHRYVLRWIALLPFSFLAALFSNSARITIGWHFRRIFSGVFPEWLHEFTHIGMGMIWSLTMVTALLFFVMYQPNTKKESVR